MSYLRDVCADKGHVCPSTAVEGTDAIRLYTCSNRTRLRGDRAAFYFTSNDSSKQALCPRTARPYLARRFYRNVFCLSVRGSDRTARTSDRWQLSVSRREKEEPIVVMIFFSSHLLFPTPRTNTNYCTGLGIISLVLEKKEEVEGGGVFVSSFSLFSFLFSLVQIILLGRKSRKHFIRTYNPVDRRKLKV